MRARRCRHQRELRARQDGKAVNVSYGLRVRRGDVGSLHISPSRYIHTGKADEYRPIAEIVEELT